MTIAQVMRLIAKTKKEYALAQTRASASLVWREDRLPAYEFPTLLEQMTKLSTKLVRLKTALAIAIAKAPIEFDGKEMMLVEAVRRLDELKGAIAWLRGLDVRPNEKTSEDEEDVVRRRDDGVYVNVRETRTWHCALPETKRDVLIEKLQNDFDRLNDVVETADHRVDVTVDLD